MFIQTHTHTHIFYTHIFASKYCTNPQRPSMGEWLKKRWHIHTMEILLAHKNNKLVIHLYLKCIMLRNKASQSQRATV